LAKPYYIALEEGALSRKRREEKIRKDHIKALDKGDLVFIIFGHVIQQAKLRSR
jgi:hypothetical protein